MLYVVDDAADYRFLVLQVFRMFLPTYKLEMFVDGLELIQCIDHQTELLTDASNDPTQPAPSFDKPGLIILDVDMPKLSGYETLERLKQYPDWQSVPVVMMSNRPEAGYREAAYELGAVSYISKPINITEMRDVLEMLCHQWLDTNQPIPNR